MSECDFMRETMPLLLTEGLDPVRREHTLSSASRLEQDGYYTIGVIDYRVRLFTFSVEHRYTDLALSTAARIDPLRHRGFVIGALRGERRRRDGHARQ